MFYLTGCEIRDKDTKVKYQLNICQKKQNKRVVS